MDKNIGFIGLGNLGKNLANSVLTGGYNLFVHDLDKYKANKLIKGGAKWCQDIETLVNQSTIIITCLPNPKAISNVMEKTGGILDFINSNHLIIECSTNDEEEIIRFSKLIKLKKAKYLEAPLSGGEHRSITGNISVLTSGKRSNFERAFPVLKEIGHEIVYLGKKLGSASTVKVLTNYLASINLLSIGEALMVCKKYGIDLKKAYQGIKISSGNSFVHETESQVILNGSYDVGFTMDLACKDVGLFDQLTNNLNIPAKISPLMVKIFDEGRKKYGDRALSTSIVKLLEEKCNTDLRTEGFPSRLLDKEQKKKGIEIKS